jgi:hypothetical protein
MNTKLLYEIKSEVDGIYANGFWASIENPRIMELLPVLEKYIDEDVAYKDLHSALRRLIEMDAVKDMMEILYTIHASLNYLLRLGMKTALPGKERTEQVPLFNINDIAVRQRPFSELKPLLEAFVNDYRQIKPEIIREAYEKKLFDDFRLYPYLSRALANKQPEVAALAEDIIKNEVGDKILPFILPYYKCDNEDANLRRFGLLYELKYEGRDKLVEEIFKSKAISLQAKAIQYISTNAAYEELILKLSESSLKLLKDQIPLGLANLKTEKAEKKLLEFYIRALRKNNKEDIELCGKALSQTGLLYVFDEVLSLTKGIFDNVIVANKKAEIESLSSLRLSISIFKRQERAEVYDFFFEILFHESYNEIIRKKKYVLAKPATSVSYAIIDVIRDLDAERLTAFYEKVIGEMKESEWKEPFYKTYLKEYVRRGDAVERIYDVFAPYYRNGKINIEDIAEMCGVGESPESASNAVDSRWLDELYEKLEHIDEEEHVETLLQVLDQLEPNPSERYNQELIKVGKVTKKYLMEITSMIMKRDLPDKYELVFSLIKYCHDQGQSRSYALRQLHKANYWSEFPKAYVAKFRELKNAPKAIYNKIAENEN